MLGVIAGCERALASTLDPRTRMVFSAGIATLYASPFTKAEELGRLPEEFCEFSDKLMKDSHESLMACRHGLFSHRDMTMVGQNQHGNDMRLHLLRIEVDNQGEVFVLSPEIKWSDSVFLQVKELAEFQSARIDRAWKPIFEKVKSRAKKLPGIYTLGISYP